MYGKHFTVESDHKPLEMIQHKALTAAPPRLQRMLLRLQPYDATVKYRPGKEMVVPDGLSRGSSKNKDHIELDMQLNIVQITERRLNNIRQETAKDHILCELKEVIVHGWPDRVKELPNQLRPYWSFRDELAVEDGLILKGERVVIPKTIQEHLLTQLHMGHQGIEKTKLRAKDCVYWLDITKDIEQLVRSCSVCQEYQKSLPHETLKQHELPTRPWQVLGTDLFQLKGEPYLIVADYYSKFPIIRKMPQPCTSQAVVNATMEIFSEHGIPSKVISDNGGHYDCELQRLCCVLGIYACHVFAPLPSVQRICGALDSDRKEHPQESSVQRIQQPHGAVMPTHNPSGQHNTEPCRASLQTEDPGKHPSAHQKHCAPERPSPHAYGGKTGRPEGVSRQKSKGPSTSHTRTDCPCPGPKVGTVGPG